MTFFPLGSRWLRCRAFLAAVLSGLSAPPGIAAEGTFDRSPRQYGDSVSRALMQVGADIRFSLEMCSTGEEVECRFTSRHVTAWVQGRLQPPRTAKILLEADLLQDQSGRDPIAIITDVVLALGASVVVFDPGLPADERVRLLSDLTNTTLDFGKSEAVGRGARYSGTFDDAASGLIVFTISPLE